MLGLLSKYFDIIKTVQKAGYNVVSVYIDNNWEFFTYDDFIPFNSSNHIFTTSVRGKHITKWIFDHHMNPFIDENVVKGVVDEKSYKVFWSFSKDVEFVDFKGYLNQE